MKPGRPVQEPDPDDSSPDPAVAGWPLIGKPIAEIWLLASQNLESTIIIYKEPLSKLGITILGGVGGFGKGLILFFLSLIIAGAFLIKADASADFVRKLTHRLAGKKSDEIIHIAGVSIRNVVKGILGVAFFQFIAAGTVFMLAKVPFPGLWALAVLVLAILQLPAGHCHVTRHHLPFLSKTASVGYPVGNCTGGHRGLR